jgi:hypothetical protein
MRRHTFFVCGSEKCEIKFEKDTLDAADKGCGKKVAARIKDYAKGGRLHCPHCFFMLKEMTPPEVQRSEDIVPPAPPPRARAVSSDSGSSSREEKAEEDEAKVPPESASGIEIDPRAPELPDLDLDNLVVHIKESSDNGRSPTHVGKKQGKKNKKQQATTLNSELVQALFFEDPRQPAARENAWMQTDSTARENISKPQVKAPAKSTHSETPQIKSPTQSMATRVEQNGSALPSDKPGLVSMAVERGMEHREAKALSIAELQRWISSQVSKSSPAISIGTPPTQAPPALPIGAAPSVAWGPKKDATDTAYPKEKAGDRQTEAARKNPRTRAAAIQPAKAEAAKSEVPQNLPANWKAAWDKASKEYYYWNTVTKEVTWDLPIQQEEDRQAPTTSTTVKHEKAPQSPQYATSNNSPTVSTMCSFSSSLGAVEYLVIRSWVPNESEKKTGECIRVTHGERVVLDQETLDGWGIGSVIPEAGESVRQGRFPRKVLSDNPVASPKILAKGVRVKVIDEFASPANGYLSTSMGETLVVKYQAEPFIWVWAEVEGDSKRNGWVPEAVLVMA